jgi:hypothetical protein
MKKAFAIVLALALALSIASAITAATPSADAADKLHALGLFQGVGANDDDTPNFDLDREPTRAEAAVMLVRLLGKESEAENGEWDFPFTDVPEWARSYVGYAYANKLTNGISATLFGSDLPVTATQYLTFVLRALGYVDGTDFIWSNAWTLTDTLGITNKEYNASANKIVRGGVASVSFDALKATDKASGKAFYEALIQNGAITKDDAIKVGFPDPAPAQTPATTTSGGGGGGYTPAPSVTTYTLTFIYSIDSPFLVKEYNETSKVTPGVTFMLPMPVEEGHTFLGWHYDSAFTQLAEPGVLVTKNMTLYGKWHCGTVYTLDELQAAILSPYEIEIRGDITIPAGVLFTIPPGAHVTVMAGSTLTIDGVLTVNGALAVVEEAKLNLGDGGDIIINGTIDVKGDWVGPEGGWPPSAQTASVTDSSELKEALAKKHVTSIFIDGNVLLDGKFDTQGREDLLITINSGSTLTFLGSFELCANLVNNGTLVLRDRGNISLQTATFYVRDGGALTNNNIITIGTYGNIYVSDYASFTNSGSVTIAANGKIHVSGNGIFTDNGTITGEGSWPGKIDTAPTEPGAPEEPPILNAGDELYLLGVKITYDGYGFQYQDAYSDSDPTAYLFSIENETNLDLFGISYYILEKGESDYSTFASRSMLVISTANGKTYSGTEITRNSTTVAQADPKSADSESPLNYAQDGYYYVRFSTGSNTGGNYQEQSQIYRIDANPPQLPEPQILNVNDTVPLFNASLTYDGYESSTISGNNKMKFTLNNPTNDHLIALGFRIYEKDALGQYREVSLATITDEPLTSSNIPGDTPALNGYYHIRIIHIWDDGDDGHTFSGNTTMYKIAVQEVNP